MKGDECDNVDSSVARFNRHMKIKHGILCEQCQEKIATYEWKITRKSYIDSRHNKSEDTFTDKDI